MGAVSHIADFRGRSAMPTLVLVDLHVDFPHSAASPPDSATLASVLAQCREVLVYARRCGMPIALVRHMPPLPSFLATHDCPAWMRGIEPRRSDMIFERASPSCYTSSEFAQMAAHSSELVLAGLFGETSCLSTLVEAHHRGQRITYLADASCSRGYNGVSAEAMHRSVVDLGGLYGRVCSVRDWMEKAVIQIGARG